MANLVGGWNNGSVPGFLSDLGDRGKYRRDVEFENMKHANAKDLAAHNAQLAHENRIREMVVDHEHVSARDAAMRDHETAMERLRGNNIRSQRRQDHANAMEMETHRTTTATNLFQTVGGGAPARQFSMGDMSVSFGPPKSAAAKKPSAPKASQPAAKTKASAKPRTPKSQAT